MSADDRHIAKRGRVGRKLWDFVYDSGLACSSGISEPRVWAADGSYFVWTGRELEEVDPALQYNRALCFDPTPGR